MLGINTEILAGWNIYIVWDNARTNDLHHIGMLSSRIKSYQVSVLLYTSYVCVCETNLAQE